MKGDSPIRTSNADIFCFKPDAWLLLDFDTFPDMVSFSPQKISQIKQTEIIFNKSLDKHKYKNNFTLIGSIYSVHKFIENIILR